MSVIANISDIFRGFDSYEELRYNGIVVDIEDEIKKTKTPSPKL